jgi:ferric-dicitrate binding protein FerR (iron transport regulator)
VIVMSMKDDSVSSLQHFTLGEIWLKQGLVTQAAQAFQNALAVEPGFAAALNELQRIGASANETSQNATSSQPEPAAPASNSSDTSAPSPPQSQRAAGPAPSIQNATLALIAVCAVLVLVVVWHSTKVVHPPKGR